MEEAAEQKKEVEIFPLSKGKRIVAFLADFFLVFVISFAFFHLALYPLSAFSTNLYNEQEDCLKAQKDRDQVLYGNSLLFYEEGKSNAEPSSFSQNLSYTGKLYVMALAGKATADYDVFRHFFVDIRGKESEYPSWVKSQDEKTQFFSYSPKVELLPRYVEEFSPFFETGNTPSKQGEEDYEKFQKEFFLPCYSSLMKDILENDLTYQGISYVAKQNQVASFSQKANRVVVWSASISYLLSCALIFIVVPLISKTRKTLGMIFLRRERVVTATLMPIKRRYLPLLFLYGVFFNAGLLFLLPWPIITFNELFSLPALWALSLISLLLDLVSLFFVLFDSFDRTLMDRLMRITMLDEESMDAIYRSKGYGD